MTALVHSSIDDIDCEILAELQANARIAFAELGRRVGLSTPAVIERVHRLEESKVILGYRTLVDPAQVGLPVRAFVHVTVAGDKLVKVHFFSARGWVSQVHAQYQGFLQTLGMQPVHGIDQAAGQWLERFQSVLRKRTREDVSDLMFGECGGRQCKSHDIRKAEVKPQ